MRGVINSARGGAVSRPLLLALLIAGLCGRAAAQDEAPPVVVEEARIEPVVEKVSLSGTVTSPRVAQVSTSVAGLISEMPVDTGTQVDKGDVLVKFDAALETLSLEQSKASTREAREELSEAKRRLRIALNLVDRDTIPETEVDARRAQVRIAEARVARLEAEQARQAERVERHTLEAPFDSIVSEKMTEVGEWIDPGTAIVELVAMEGLRVDVPVPQRHFPAVNPDTAVSVAFDALPDRDFGARIGKLVPVSDPTARTFTMRVLLDDAQVAITPGMSARVTLKLETGTRDVVVSRDALIRFPDGRVIVWVLDTGGDTPAVEERRIETGLMFDGKVQVKDGLEAGERVVVRGNEALREGQKVRITDGA